jgi:hypothetical protein
MTQVRIALDVPGSAGDVRATGDIRATPTRRRTVGDAIVLPAPFSATLVDGVVTVEMAATSSDWCWRVDEVMPYGVASSTRFVAVPQSDLTLGYEDLVDVDPDTLDPAAEPEAAWNLALESTDASVAWLDALVASMDAEIEALKLQVPLVLNEDDPIPPLTPALKLVVRSVTVPPIPDLDIVEATLTLNRVSTGVNLPLVVPAGTVVGDRLVAIITNSTTAGTIATPAGGWELAQHLTTFADYRTTYVFFFDVTGAVPANPTFVASGSARMVGTIFRVLGADLDAPAVNGTSGSRTTNTMNIPALAGTADHLALVVANVQAVSPNQPVPHVLPAGFTKLFEVPSTDDTAVTRTVLVVGWAIPAGDLGASTVVAASSIAAGAAQMLAIKGLA